MKLTINTMKLYAALSILVAGIFTACQPDEFGNGDGNGLSDPGISASFTITPVEGKNNTYVFAADQTDLIGVRWDKDDGVGFPKTMGKAIDTVFYPDAGTYTITLKAYGRGGASAVSSKTLTVDTSDPASGNLVVGGKMNAGDESKWNFVTYSAGVTFAILDNKMIASGGSGGHAGIYQAIQVEGGKKYKVDMTVSGSGATDVWFEVYVGTAEPVPGKDYNDGGTRLGLNTWAGCGKTAFNAKLSSISCSGSGGVVTFPQSGTVYLMIRTGGSNLGTTGISIDNVELRGTK
ncbi:MAG TPA: PKD domain-containing protein [Ohtaekwangia sp.]|uniref:PKD domain-containing protein n=1 Tax=Ohtaekwangia sp. TaxID=2066019 RepID=UPI002F941336